MLEKYVQNESKKGGNFRPLASQDAEKSNDMENLSASTELLRFVLPRKPHGAPGEVVLRRDSEGWAAWAVLSSQSRAQQTNSELSQMAVDFRYYRF